MTSPVPPPAGGIEPTEFAPPRVPSQYRPASVPQAPPAPSSYTPGYAYPSIPRQPAGYPANPYEPLRYTAPVAYPPVVLPPPTRPSRWPLAVVVALVLAVLGAGGGAVALGAFDRNVAVAWEVGQGRPGAPAATNRDGALGDLLNRRGTAVLGKDQAAFLADVDRSDPTWVKRQETIFANLQKLPLTAYGLKLHADRAYDSAVPPALRERFGDQARAVGVTVTYQIEGIDTEPVAVPWVPVFAPVDGRWTLVGEAGPDKELPTGVGGQPWDGEAITVQRSDHVTGVFSAGRDNPAKILNLAEKALGRVAVVRPAGWVGKVFVIATRDRKVFDAYFGDNPERVDQVAAIAVPHYNEVHNWGSSNRYAATRVIFNPDQLDEDQLQLGDDLTHEFTHAAMAPVTSGWTPTWLVEGFAEYVSYKGANIQQSKLREALRGVSTADLLAGEEFYDEPANYLTGWLACRMISEKWSEAKLIALYEGFQSTSNEDAVINKVLGISRDALVKQWQEYVARQRA
ncbi:hypothetical protein [Virgisporangium aliadipatigenens]|uniref:hypothetical protein n=1 Tax=Virgisporangium aliadipatigenens TaxID=741659 RepID=UPI001942914E|nr:hypothetical protein [Virgisporangium aliadipatigenens]